MANKRQIRFLEPSEIEAMIAKIRRRGERNLRDRALLAVLFSTGLRVSEALALPSKEFDPKAGVPETKELSIVGKGGWQRTIYFSPTALIAIFEYQCVRDDKQEPLLFPITPRCVQKMIKRVAVKAGITKFVSPHVMRHSYATDLLNKGVDIRFVQEFLGHRSISNTMIYAHVANSRLKKIHIDLYK